MASVVGPGSADARSYLVLQNVLDTQATVYAYIDDLRYMALVCFLCVPIVFFVKSVKAKKGAAPGRPLAHEFRDQFFRTTARNTVIQDQELQDEIQRLRDEQQRLRDEQERLRHQVATPPTAMANTVTETVRRTRPKMGTDLAIISPNPRGKTIARLRANPDNKDDKKDDQPNEENKDQPKPPLIHRVRTYVREHRKGVLIGSIGFVVAVIAAIFLWPISAPTNPPTTLRWTPTSCLSARASWAPSPASTWKTIKPSAPGNLWLILTLAITRCCWTRPKPATSRRRLNYAPKTPTYPLRRRPIKPISSLQMPT